MTTINLKDFYYWYIQDQFIEVSEEVAEALRASVRYEAAYQRRLTRHKAQYSAGYPGPPDRCSHHSWQKHQRDCRGRGCA